MEQKLKVIRIRPTGSGVFELVLERRGVAFTPGDCLALHGASGVESRPYSIASGVDDDYLRFVIRHLPGGQVSKHLAELGPGDVVPVSPPFGWFRPGEEAGAPFVFVATGTGIAPFLSYLRSRPQRAPSVLLWGVRNIADAVELPWIEQHCRVELAVSRESPPGRHHGRVTDLLECVPQPSTSHFYLCGLDAMIRQVSGWLLAHSVPQLQIHRECFFNVDPLRQQERSSAA